jgi:hypothetical protein
MGSRGRLFSSGSWTTLTTTFPVIRLDCSCGRIFAVSNTYSGSGKNKTSLSDRFWIVRKGSPDGIQWSTHDDFNRIPGGTSSQATGVAADEAGSLYTCGLSEGGPDGSHKWIVRRAFAATP